MAEVIPRRRVSSEAGAELVEFALVLPLMLLLVMGIFDFGLLFREYEVITNAAREGARVSVLPGYGVADVQQRVNQYIQASGLPALATPATVGPTQQIAVGANCIRIVPVTVSMTHQFFFLSGIASYFGGSFGSKTLTATSAMRSEVAAASCP